MEYNVHNWTESTFLTEHGLQCSIYTLLVKSTKIFKTTRDLVPYDFFFIVIILFSYVLRVTLLT